MIFLRYEIIKNEIKNEIKENTETDGVTLVKYSISYPSVKGKNGFAKTFCGFYSLLAKRFEDFAKTRLLAEAKRYKALESGEFQPFGAVMKFICSYNDCGLVSIVTDIFVFCGNGKQESKRMSQNWHVEKTRMLIFEDFFLPCDKENILQGIKNEARLRVETNLSTFFEDYEKRIKKGFSKNDFYLTPKGYGFFYPALYLSESSAFDVFFLLGFKGSGEYNPY